MYYCSKFSHLQIIMIDYDLTDYAHVFNLHGIVSQSLLLYVTSYLLNTRALKC